VNWDQTVVLLVSSSKYSMAAVGSKQVSVVGGDDKRQITALLTITASGILLAPQLIYQGTTERCNLKYRLPPEFLVDHTSSHWSDAESMIRYVNAILILYFVNKRIELCLPESQVAIAIFDVNASYRFNDRLHSILKDNLIELIYIPACWTSELQPLDADGGPNGKLK